MKDLSLLVFLTQLGLTVALPLGGFVLLGAWLRQQLGWGVWVIIVSIVLGVILAVQGLVNMLRTIERMTKDKQETPLSFNEHD